MLTLITVATDPSRAEWLSRSASIFGFKLNLLGVGQPYPPKVGGFPHNSIKILHISRALEVLHGVVVFVDGYDCLVVRDAAAMEAQFVKDGRKIIMATEHNCWPDSRLAEMFPHAPTHYRWLNSGCFIGDAADLRNLFKQINYGLSPSDQLLFSWHFLLKPGEISLDYRCEYFQCFFPCAENHVVVSERGIVNKHTGCAPYIVHGNGGADMTIAREWLAARYGGPITLP